MSKIKLELIDICKKARNASVFYQSITTQKKNEALLTISSEISKNIGYILSENEKDIENAKKNGVSKPNIDRLTLTESRLQAICGSLEKVASLSDPTGISDGWTRPNGLYIQRKRVPIGVLAIIYEARPNVTVDAASLCIKSGNAVILRGGSDAINSNVALSRVINTALSSCGFPDGAVTLVESTDRAYTAELLKLSGHIDAAIPRGSGKFIRFVKENSTVPVIETGAGVCHVYVHEDADLDMAVDITVNAKTSRPSVCNAAETLLVHEKKAKEFLSALKPELDKFNVELRGCEKSKKILPNIISATEEDYFTEYNDYIMSLKIVSSLDEAIEHINTHNTKHSEAIVTSSIEASERFAKEIDAAVVYTNASTRFTDGEEFGFGAEIGISTQKLHARGPMGLNELTCIKYVVLGSGMIR